MKKVLVTGFMPFDNRPTNPSWAVAQRVTAQSSPYANIVCEEIQVLWHNSTVVEQDGSKKWYKSTLNYLKDAVAIHQPDCLICVGEGNELTLECVGRNEAIVCADNAGKLYVENQDSTVALKEGAPKLLPATFVENISSFIAAYNAHRREHEVLVYSDNAGGYLCNLALYESLRLFSDSIQHIGFIHTINTESSINGAVQVIEMLIKKLYKPTSQELLL